MEFKHLQNPYPYTARFPESLKTILFISGFIFLFVYVFRSDNFIGTHNPYNKLLFSSYYGLATLLISSFNTLVFSSVVKPEDEKNWKVWNEIILYVIHFVTISFAIHFLSFYVTNRETTLKGIFYSMAVTTLVGLIPVSIHVLNEQKKFFKKHYELANKISEDSAIQKKGPVEESINIEGQSYLTSDLLYFESNRNYLNIYMTDERLFTIRCTIKEMENLLTLYTQFIRCHRAYIVNTYKIKNVEGNAQGLKVFLHDFPSFVPVSRSYIPKVSHAIHPND